MPLATAAAEPPLEPPVTRVVSHGLRLGPKSFGSVVGRMPYSGVLVLPRTISPARLYRDTNSLSCGAMKSARNAEPEAIRAPAYEASRSFSKNGTPVNGPSGIELLAVVRASSNIGVIT